MFKASNNYKLFVCFYRDWQTDTDRKVLVKYLILSFFEYNWDMLKKNVCNFFLNIKKEYDESKKQ